jgi:DNA polymerase-3 subunit chi
MDIGFYHVTRGGADAVLPRLLERALAAGLKVAVRAADPAERARLDRLLWEYQPESFLPHGTEDGPDPAEQPVLLTAGDMAANGAAMLVALAPPLPRAGFERVALLFADADADAARAEWRALKAEGLAASYWKQGAKGWEAAG